MYSLCHLSGEHRILFFVILSGAEHEVRSAVEGPKRATLLSFDYATLPQRETSSHLPLRSDVWMWESGV